MKKRNCYKSAGTHKLANKFHPTKTRPSFYFPAQAAMGDVNVQDTVTGMIDEKLLTVTVDVTVEVEVVVTNRMRS